VAGTVSRSARLAAQLLGTEIAQGRRERRWTVEQLAQRCGVSPTTVRKVERGDSGVAVGTVFELAVLTSVPLFSDKPDELSGLLVTSRDRLALLPKRVREPRRPVNDDF
jgi:transcriptional regulator with XRE-family HTH domain